MSRTSDSEHNIKAQPPLTQKSLNQEPRLNSKTQELNKHLILVMLKPVLAAVS